MQSVLRITYWRDTLNYLVSKRIPNAEAFLEYCERITMKSKSVVFRQGELSQDFYVILEGSV
jgi:CRP-like cAMP-binding protein